MKIVKRTDIILYSAPSEYNEEKYKLLKKGYMEIEKDLIFTGNGIYATFVKETK